MAVLRQNADRLPLKQTLDICREPPAQGPSLKLQLDIAQQPGSFDRRARYVFVLNWGRSIDLEHRRDLNRGR